LRLLLPFIALAMSQLASAAPVGTVTLVGEYCGLGPCMPITATLSPDHSCSFDFMGTGRWEYDPRRSELRIYTSPSIVLTLQPGERCGYGFVDLESRGLPSEYIEMCPL
jgi:hypothetical protein